VPSPRRIIGVDPGLVSTGWGIIEMKGNQLSFVGCGTIAPKKEQPLAERLLALHRELREVIDRHFPTEAALEETFVTQNGASTLKLGQARGALLVTLSSAGLAVSEYATRLVKKSVVGTGSADKNQIAQMVGVLLPASRQPMAACRHDAADALAVAIAHANHATYTGQR
jgi:crossover junction endodeoxyribonuclease RuvC